MVQGPPLFKAFDFRKDENRNDNKYNEGNDITPCYDWYNRGRGLTCAAPDLYDTLERPQALLPVCRDI